MTEQQVISVFSEVVQDNELMKSIEATKHQRYEWRHLERGNVKLATMLEVLFKLNMLNLKNEPTGAQK